MLNWLKKLISGSYLRRRLEEPVRNGDNGSDTDPIEEFRSYISREVAAGYASPEEALDIAIDIMSNDVEVALLQELGPKILAEELRLKIEMEAHWPSVTDCDRLDSAFASLESKGVIARQNYSCCGTCGSFEIWEELVSARDAGMPVRGYTFFHQQDTESAIEGDFLYLNYGSINDGDEDAISIGHEVHAELKAHGLDVDWDGDLSKRIGVSLSWQRRMKRPTSERLH